jgi:signal transduction histidine kinase/CheY-like chemotaxis protein
MDFLGQLTESIGIVLNTIETNTRTEELLMQSQSLASELKSQQEELRHANDELQEKAFLLAKQKEEVEKTNKEVEEARRSLEEKAEQLAMASKYKSEFLANMSHELRTPLNSLLILAQQLYENKEGNLQEKQVKFAKTIYSCGDDLIQLINDILDLSKIESGVISPNINSVSFAELCSYVETTFRPLSETKKLRFTIEVDKKLPETIETDSRRLKQILKNLLSNSFKFTEKGEIRFRIFTASEPDIAGIAGLNNINHVLGFEITDTGIGIPEEKQQIIFEAFQQVEGSTSRKYGGTGLGLSISKGLAKLLGGAIKLRSVPAKGSSFILFLPAVYDNVTARKRTATITGMYENGFSNLLNGSAASVESAAHDSDLIEIVHEIINEVDDDRGNIGAKDKVLLVVEDDLRFAKIILEKSHEFGLKTVIASRYNEIFFLCGKFKPAAVTLDVNLPDTNGWKVLNLIKNDLDLRHIPIHIISGEENSSLAYSRGARSFILKPISNDQVSSLLTDIAEYSSKAVKELLIIGENQLNTAQMFNVLNGLNINVKTVLMGNHALSEISTKVYDAVVIYTSSEETELKEQLKIICGIKPSFTPVIIYSSKLYTDIQLKELKEYAGSAQIKSVNSFEKLLEETVIILHLNHKELKPECRESIEEMRKKEDILKGKSVLIVDDDVRNLFALTSVLEKYEMVPHTAESGSEAINVINSNDKIDIVLMDIMMPEMDGYETIKKIRRECRKQALPIIAVTAKAMKGDREKSIKAGASDYITKPVNLENLLALMRIWMY